MNKLVIAIIGLILMWSCGKDDTPQAFDNFAPVVHDQAFNLSGTITGAQEIGVVKAFDSNTGTQLNYSITTNFNDLFQINEATGLLSLKTGKELDLDASPLQKITVLVTDGEEEDDAQITICDCTPRFAQESYVFEMDEQISTAVLIHTFEVTDVDTEASDFVFGIPTNDNGMFEINEAGELSLASGESLDYETATEHNIIVSVTDGTETVEVDVLIKVINTVDSLAEDPGSFITTWKTDGNGETIYLGLNPAFNYDFTIDWGDGTVEDFNLSNPVYISHVYESSGNHIVAIAGDFPAIRVASIELNGDIVNPAPKPGYGLIAINQWGTIQWKSMGYAFGDAIALEIYEATDTPNLSQLNMNMTQMFKGAELFNADLNDWDVSNVANMAGMLQDAAAFNGDISDWKVTNVSNMHAMFSGATSFNGDISNWILDKVALMSKMFENAASFDQDLGSWKIGSVTNMSNMLDGSGMSITNYSNTLIGWADQEIVPSEINLGAEGLEYCGEEAIFARTFLGEGKNWTITGDSECL